ncbi:hypothetical protein NEPAR04_0330 [Nematocida parisii]|nr:hypothetical protein NEPAR03_0080 [Nematocida parisii]KAI5125529.1 hypothetical protein NEPAR08_0080 [Nematocida parisii]KAI5140589.1 hypothetical protein NEPAR04_0330 [Nematocida parisii]
MLHEEEDTLTRTAIRLKELTHQGNKEVKEIIDRMNRNIQQDMNITIEYVLNTINELFQCDTLHSNEKYAVLDVFHQLLEEFLNKGIKPDLQRIPGSLGKMKFLKNEKNVERAVVVYLKVIMLMLQVVDTPDHRISIFKVFCTLFMSKSFITSTKCGYLIPGMFREFLGKYPGFIHSLLDNQDKLIMCPALLEVVLLSSQRITKVLSRLVVLDCIRRNTNQLVLMMHGKGFYEPFYFQTYMERETGPVSEIFPIFCKESFLEYLFLDVGTRITSKCTVGSVIEKVSEESTLPLIRLLKDPGRKSECAYCGVSRDLEVHASNKQRVEVELEEFNKTGEVDGLVELMRVIGYRESPALSACRLLRSHTDTNLQMLGKCLGREGADAFLDVFCSSFDFSEYDLVTALRVFLLSFTLPGEGQKINRIISAFSKKYSEDQKQDSETVISIAMAVIYINTSIHNVNTVKKISLEEFTRIIMKTCKDVDVEYIETLYGQIKQRKLEVPKSNYVSSEQIEFSEQQCESDVHLHTVMAPSERYKYCSNCTLSVYNYMINTYSISKTVTHRGTPQEIKAYIKVCARLGMSDTVVSALRMVRDPYLLIKIIGDLKYLLCKLWPEFIDAIERLSLHRDDSGNAPRFFRNIFTFGKEPKKDKKDIFPDLMIPEIMEEIRNIPDNAVVEMAATLQKKLEDGKTKSLCKLSYITLTNTSERISTVSQLFETLISTGGIPVQEMVTVCESAHFSTLLHVLAGFQYKPSKHITTAVISLLQYIISVLSNKSLSIVEMNSVKEWMRALITSEAFKLKNTEVVSSIWSTVEEVSLQLDTAGFDGFEIFIKMKESLTVSAQNQIIINTVMYYKNINRVLLCLDIISKDTELKNTFISMISTVIHKDRYGCISIMESCEHVIESIPDVQERIESIIFNEVKEAGAQSTSYLKRLVDKMSIKSNEQIVDL